MIGIEKVDAQELRKVLRVLNAVEPTATKDLRSKLKSSLGGVANEVAKEIPTQAPLSGLGKNNKWGWQPKRGTIGFTPGKSRRNATNLLSVRVNYGNAEGYPFGVWIAEFAAQARSARGANLIAGLNNRKPMRGKGGRYAYNKFRELRPDVVERATLIINSTMKDLSRKLK